MPLKSNLKKKTEQEKEQSYTKQTNNVSLPKKTTTAKQSAQAIKSSVSGKKTYKPSAKKEQEVKNRVATKKNYGSEKTDTSYRNTRLGKTSSYTAQSSYKKGREAVKQKAEDTGLYVNKVDTTTPRKKKENTNPTRGNGRDTSQKKQTNRNNYNKHKLDEGAKDIQNRALSGQLNADEPTRYITDVHGRTAVDDRVRVNNLDDWFNVGGKFLSNAMDSTIDYSPLGTAYTLATGETLTNGAYNDNPYEEQRKQGLSAGAGRMAGMALNYGIARSAANPLLKQAANAVMNGTKVGSMIQNSATLGKIGQAVGTNTAKDIATGLVKETISDATLGAGQNALINYAEGLRGEDFWKQMAKDEALDFAIGGIMEGAGIGKQIGRAGREAADISEENVKDLLANATSRGEYADTLKARGLELKEKSLDTANAGRNLREASAKKGTEYTDEYRKTLNMTDQQFNRYQKGRDINAKDLVRKEGTTSAKVKAKNKTKGSALEAEADAAKTVETPNPEQTPKVDSPDSTAYNNVKGEETNGRKDTQLVQEGNLQQGTATGNSGSKSVLPEERPRNAGDIRVETEGRSRTSRDVQVSKSNLVSDDADKVLRTDKRITERTAKSADNIEEFSKRLDENRKTNEYGYCVSPVEPKDYDGSTRYYTTHNGQVTAGVAKDGNIVGLSKSSNATEGANSHEALMTAFGMGGNRADAYGIGLATHYQRYGLVPVARVPFDENVVREYFRPEEVDDALAMFRKMKDVGNEPDVYFFAKFDDLENTIKTRDNGGYRILSDDELRKLPEMDYDSAEKYRNQLLDNSAKRNAYMKEHGIEGTFTEPKTTTVEGAKRPTKRLGKKAETVAESTKPQETTKTTNGGGDLSKGGKIEKVGEFEVVGGGKGVETTTPAETKLSAIEQLKKTLRNARRDLINSEAGLERMDKVAKQTKIQEKSYMTRNAKGQAGYILNKKLVDRQGKEIGKSLSEVLGGKIEYNGKIYDSPFKDNATAKLFDEYAMELHNTYRAKQGKNIYGGRDYVEEVDQIVKNYPALAGEKDRLLKWLNDTDGTTSKEQRKALEERLRNKYENFDDVIKDLNKYRAAKSQINVDRILKEHPEFAKVTEEMDKWWNSFTDEYLVKSGIISADNVKKFKEIYPHYVPTFRDMGEAAGRESKNAATLIKKATGSGKRQLLTVPEQYAHQIDRIVTAARRNELNQEIINTISKDPAGMKAFGAIQDGKGKLTYDFSEGDLDDFITTLDDISLNQIKSGKNTITAVFNGEKVTANISDEVAKSLEAMSNIQDTNLLIKVGKTITNPMKFTITGGNPVFFISNMMRDLPTLYIQSNHGFVKTTTGLFKATKEVFTNGEKYKMYKALGGAEAGYYMRGKGFETSASTRGVIKRVQEVMSFLGEKGEAIPRLAEFINTLEKTGDAYKALRDAAESTVDFSRRGSSDVAKTLDAWTLYLNAGIQGLDKFARTVAAHPLRTAGRSATMLGIPYMALTALNQDNPYYQELTERVKQNNFLVPNLAGEKDEDGNCKTFIKVPLNREYGTVFATSLYCTLKAVRGEDDSWQGFTETFQENFLPNNPFTDNILAPLLINIPQNKDFAGRSIIPNSLKDASPENQYDYSTSEFAKLISKGMNRIPVKDVPIVKYLQSPKLVDYILDSYTGYYGQVLQSATTTGGTSKDNYVKDVLVKQTAAQPFLNKFVADSRYSSKPVEDFYNMKDEYTQLKTDAEIEGKTWSEAHAAEQALSKISKGLSESTQAEKAILADKSLTKAEKDKLIGELRTARNELAKEAKKEVTNAVEEYRQAPTFSELSDTTKEKWSISLGIKKEQWATAYKKMTDEYDSRKEENEDAKMTADEKRLYLIENGITTYKQAQSILGENTSKNKWDEALAMHKKGETYDSLTTATLEKAERQKDMTESEIKFDNNFRTRSDSRYDGKTVSKKMYDNFLYEVQYVDKNTDNNGSIKQSEAQNAIENLDQMYGLTQEQKAYLWYLAENVNSKGEGWKKQPYGKWNG